MTTVPQPTIVSPLLSIKQAAAYLNVGFSSIYEKVGVDLQAVKLGKRRYITRASCDDYIRRCTEPLNPRPVRQHRRRAA